MESGGSAIVDLDELMENSSWSNAQKGVFLLICFALILDGLDNLALGLAIPSIAADWSVAPSSFGLILAVGLLGLSVGTAVAGPLGDRFGRKLILVSSVFVFGICTVASAGTQGLADLGILRTIAGFGLGGAVPNGTALIAELTPSRRRSIAVTLGAVCIPAGAIVGGAVAAYTLPEWGWQGLFVVAGSAPLMLCPVLFWLVPESPRHLVRDTRRPQRTRKALNRLRVPYPPAATITVREDEAAPRGDVRCLFKRGMARDTWALWGAFFCSMTVGYLLINWIPTVLATTGLDAVRTSHGLLVYSCGGLVGAILAAAIIGRFSSRILIIFGAGAVIVSLGLAFWISEVRGGIVVLFALLAVQGACVMAVTSPLFAVAAFVYPTAVRSSGIAFALAFGRLGAILSSFLGGMAVASPGRASAYFLLASFLLLGTMLSLALIRHHIPPHQQRASSGDEQMREVSRKTHG